MNLSKQMHEESMSEGYKQDLGYTSEKLTVSPGKIWGILQES